MTTDKERKLSDLLKKVVDTGLNAASLTEDTVKNIVQELPEAKDMMNGLLHNAKQTKDVFVKSVKSEVASYLEKVDVSGEIDRVLEKYDIEVNAKIKLTPKAKKGTRGNSSKSKKD